MAGVPAVESWREPADWQKPAIEVDVALPRLDAFVQFGHADDPIAERIVVPMTTHALELVSADGLEGAIDYHPACKGESLPAGDTREQPAAAAPWAV